MADNTIGNSEGSIFRGADGNAYQVVKGRNVQVSNDSLRVEGYQTPSDVVVGGKTYRNKNGKVYRVEGNKLVEISDQNELMRLDSQMHGKRQKSGDSSLIFGGIALIVLFALLKK